MSTKLLAYCAGVIDSDGCITIKRRTTKRVSPGIVRSETFLGSVSVRQVEIGAISLLKELFGGTVRVHRAYTPGGRGLNHWERTHSSAVAIASALLPYLRIKHEQAKILLEFDALMKNTEARRHPYWFTWLDGEPTYTPREAAELKGLTLCSIYQIVTNGTVPTRRVGRQVFIPKRFWDAYQTSTRGRSPLPEGYMSARSELCARIRRLNGPTKGVPTLSH